VSIFPDNNQTQKNTRKTIENKKNDRFIGRNKTALAKQKKREPQLPLFERKQKIRLTN